MNELKYDHEPAVYTPANCGPGEDAEPDSLPDKSRVSAEEARRFNALDTPLSGGPGMASVIGMSLGTIALVAAPWLMTVVAGGWQPTWNVATISVLAGLVVITTAAVVVLAGWAWRALWAGLICGLTLALLVLFSASVLFSFTT